MLSAHARMHFLLFLLSAFSWHLLGVLGSDGADARAEFWHTPLWRHVQDCATYVRLSCMDRWEMHPVEHKFNCTHTMVCSAVRARVRIALHAWRGTGAPSLTIRAASCWHGEQVEHMNQERYSRGHEQKQAAALAGWAAEAGRKQKKWAVLKGDSFAGRTCRWARGPRSVDE